jgi:hypothetical protein
MNELSDLPSGPEPSAAQSTASAVLAPLLRPLARLCIGHGLAIQVVEEALRHAMVSAAAEACGAPIGASRMTSRISTMTGLTRREVARLQATPSTALPATRSLATEVFTRWAGDPVFPRAEGRPAPMPRVGPSPSFEALAASVTRDVHPRSMLEELRRLGLVAWDESTDTVQLLQEAFVPRGDRARQLGFLAENVGDHFQGAVANVLGHGDAHFDQALFADELSAPSLDRARELISAQWNGLMSTLVPQLLALMDEDRAQGRPQDQAVRIGLYSYTRPMATQEAGAAPPAGVAPGATPLQEDQE